MNQCRHELYVYIFSCHDIHHVFLWTVYDWLSHLTQTPSLWSSYDSSLSEQIHQQIPSYPVAIIKTANLCIGASPSMQSLITRYQLLHVVTQCDTIVNPTSPPLHLLLASTLVQEVYFVPYSVCDLWQTLDGSCHPLTTLRQQRPCVRQHIDAISLMTDVTHHWLESQHGHLSSLSLIHGYHFVYVVILQELTLYPYPELMKVKEILLDTLTLLRGVFTDENHWL